jgi:UDP-N-acetylmuramate dehydrogenase
MKLERLAKFLNGVKRDEPLAPHTSFRIGGPAKLFLRAKTAEEVEKALNLAQEEGIPWVVLGKGTNVLVADGGFPGLVVVNACGRFELEELGDKALLRAEAGVSLAHLARLTALKGWEGLEWAEGIPGTIGGAIAGNAGAFGGCVADVLERVEILGEKGQRLSLKPEELAFGYRHSAFKGELKGSVILSADFTLVKREARGLKERMLRYRAERRAKQPKEPSAGSVFKNPPGHYAAKLIEEVGLKGFRVGDACFSPIHANFIVNLGQAKASDVLKLMELAMDRVWNVFGLKLEPELEFIGLNPPGGKIHG